MAHCDKHPDADTDSVLVCLTCDDEQQRALADVGPLREHVAALEKQVAELNGEVARAWREKDEATVVEMRAHGIRLRALDGDDDYISKGDMADAFRRHDAEVAALARREALEEAAKAADVEAESADAIEAQAVTNESRDEAGLLAAAFKHHAQKLRALASAPASPAGGVTLVMTSLPIDAPAEARIEKLLADAKPACAKCGGRGWLPDSFDSQRCNACGGTGRAP